MRRLIRTATKEIPVTDRDFYGNKRLELAGDVLALIFEDAFKTMNVQISKIADEMSKKQKLKNVSVEKFVDSNRLTNMLQQAISSGNIHLDRFRHTIVNSTQVLSRFCYLSALGQLMRLSSSFDKNLKAVGPRLLNASQYGICCPSDTPEGESVGLIKNLAILAQISHN